MQRAEREFAAPEFAALEIGSTVGNNLARDERSAASEREQMSASCPLRMRAGWECRGGNRGGSQWADLTDRRGRKQRAHSRKGSGPAAIGRRDDWSDRVTG